MASFCYFSWGNKIDVSKDINYLSNPFYFPSWGCEEVIAPKTSELRCFKKFIYDLFVYFLEAWSAKVVFPFLDSYKC